MSKEITASCSISSISRSTTRAAPIILWLAKPTSFLLLLLLLAVPLQASGELPAAEKPRVSIDSTYRHPSGATRFVGSGGDLQATINAAEPGDTIVLDAGVTYSGNFTLPVKSNPNNKWIYIVGSALGKLPQGTRVRPTDAANMPTIVTPNANPVFSLPPGANHYRLAGLEIYSLSNQGCNLKTSPPFYCFSYSLVSLDSAIGQPLVDSVTVDRCYLHGSPTQDVRRGVAANGSNVAVVHSYISDIHQSTSDSQAIAAWYSPGPIKIVDNYLEATGENVMFGGAGGLNNPWVPSDIEIRNNYFFKPLSWAAAGVTLPPQNVWAEKNHLEFKSGRRVLVDGNIMENTWASAQTGSSVLFTVRTNQSGLIAVVDDITFSNNILKNVQSGFSTLAADNACLPASGCTNRGETRRINLYNNLIQLRDPNGVGGTNNFGVLVSDGLTDFIAQHNTFVPAPGTNCYQSVFFNNHGFPPPTPTTHNVWILDNALCRQPTGNGGGQGTTGLTYYMGDPSPLDQRFRGNVMLVAASDQPQSFPKGNVSTSKLFVHKNSDEGNNELLPSKQLHTSDGTPAGANMAQIDAAIAPRAVPPAGAQPEVVMLRAMEKAEFHSVTGRSSWRISPKKGSITSTGVYTAPASINEPSGITACASDAEAGDVCASIVLLPTS